MPHSHTLRILPLVALLALLASCGSGDTPPLPTFPVELRLGGTLPVDGQVGEYTVTFTEARVVLGDWTVYGMDREAAGYAFVLNGVRKHAGHAHGEAEMETHVAGTWAIDLLDEPASLAVNELTEGHYFDGSLRLRPANDTYAPVFPDTGEPVPEPDDLWGHTLLLRGEASRDASTVYSFELTVDAEAMLCGLEYGGTVKEGGATTITTRLDLGALLAGLDFGALADGDHHVQIDAATGGDAYLELKSRLQDPTLYLHEEAEAIPTE